MSYGWLPPPYKKTSSSTYDDYSIFNYPLKEMLYGHLQGGL